MKINYSKKKRRRQIIWILSCISLMLSSCSSPNPEVITTESYYFYNLGNYQNGFSGQYLSDSLVIGYNGNIFNPDSNKTIIATGIHVHFNVDSENGIIDQPDQEFPPNGKVTTKWKLGVSSFNQVATAIITDKTGKLLSTIKFSAFGFQKGRWDMISYFPNGYPNDLVRDTINNITLMIQGSTLFQQSDSYFKWQKVNSFSSHSCHSIEIAKNGTLYVGTWDGKLFKSTDQAKTFSECTKPIPEYSGYFDLTVTSDDKVWISRYTYPLRYSSDGGQTWKNSLTGLNTDSQATDIFRLSNGTFVTWMGSSGNASLLKSADGINWSAAGTLPAYTQKVYVTDKDEIFAFSQQGEISAYKSTNYGQSFSFIHSFTVSYITMPMYNTVSKFNGYYYVCIPGAGIYKTLNFNSFDQTYINSDVRSLMIDHNGAFFVTNFSFNKEYTYSPN